MGLVDVLDFVVLLAVVISVSRAVWMRSSSRLLSVVTVLAICIVGMVSFATAAEFTEKSALGRGILIVFLVAIIVSSIMSWASKPAPHG
jgi:hypothetical protein